MHSHAVPGSSWRVGVGKVEEAEAEAAGRAAAAAGQGGGVRSMMRQASRQGGGKVKAAVMTVSVVACHDDAHAGGIGGVSSVVDLESEAQQEDGAAMIIELWRADLLAGVVELAPGCTIVRADVGTGQLLGVSPANLLQHHLYT